VTSHRATAQSLVEFSLVAPILLFLVVAVWDGGGLLREQLILQESARAGARLAATGFGTVQTDQIVSAARAAGGDLPLGPSDPVSVDPVAGSVDVSHTHQLYTPILRRLWGNGSGEVVLHARAQFAVPTQGPLHVTLPAPAIACTFDMDIPALDNNKGWFSPPLQIAARTDAGYFLSRLLVNWSFVSEASSVEIALYQGNPFASKTNPTDHLAPKDVSNVYAPWPIVKDGGPTMGLSINVTAPTITPGSTYTVYFYNFGNRVPTNSLATFTYLKTACP
jgi:hypothetical protein